MRRTRLMLTLLYVDMIVAGLDTRRALLKSDQNQVLVAALGQAAVNATAIELGKLAAFAYRLGAIGSEPLTKQERAHAPQAS